MTTLLSNPWQTIVLTNASELAKGCNVVHFYNLLVIPVFRLEAPCPPIDSVMRLMTDRRITGKIIRTVITGIDAHL